MGMVAPSPSMRCVCGTWTSVNVPGRSSAPFTYAALLRVHASFCFGERGIGKRAMRYRAAARR